MLSFASFGAEPIEKKIDGIIYRLEKHTNDDGTLTGTLTISKDKDVKDDTMPEREVSADGVNKTIGRNSIQDDDNTVTTIIIEDGITKIGNNVFQNCKKLTSITIPNSVTKIGDSAFNGCIALESIAIPNSVTDIGWSVFYGCKALKSIIIPNSVTDIGWTVFYDCTALESVTMSDNVTSIGNYTFQNCSSLTSIIIPSKVTDIGNQAFSGCSKLRSVIILDGVTSISGMAFKGCTALESVTIPNSVTSIDYFAFQNCSSLKSIIIPNSVTNIYSSAFEGCTALNSGDVYYLGTEAKWDNITIYDKNDPLTSAKRHDSCNILTVNKVWKDNDDSGLRCEPTFVLYKLNSGGGHDKINNEDGEKYKEWEVTYVNGLPVEFDNATGKVINGDGAEKDVWLCKFIIFDHVADNKYAVSEDPMVGYTSSAPTP